jgi:hypothetical protein
MFSAIISSLGGVFINKFIDGALQAFTAYQNKQISVEELKDRLLGLMVNAARDIEVSHADALAKTYASFMDAMKQSILMQTMWACTVGSQLFVLVWHQLAIPFIAFAFAVHYPSSGETVNWAYLLLGACLGMGPLVLRNGPGAMSTDKFKALISK